MSKYPLHEQVAEHREECQTLGNFLEFLESGGFTICEFDRGCLWPVSKSIEEWIGEYLGIDVQEFHAEKQRLYEEMVKAYD